MLDDYTVLPETPRCCATCLHYNLVVGSDRHYWGCWDVPHIDARIPEVAARGHCSDWWDKYSPKEDGDETS